MIHLNTVVCRCRDLRIPFPNEKDIKARRLGCYSKYFYPHLIEELMIVSGKFGFISRVNSKHASTPSELSKGVDDRNERGERVVTLGYLFLVNISDDAELFISYPFF